MTKIAKIILTISVILSVSFNAQAQSLVSYVSTQVDQYSTTRKIQSKAPEKVNYDLWEVLLKKKVSATGIVNYQGFREDSDKFNDFLRQLSKVKINTTWSKADKMAF